MSPPRRNSEKESAVRLSLLDAAQQILLEQGYSAVSARAVASELNLDPSIVYYYFETMDGLFIALAQRATDRVIDQQRAALSSPQPLWGLWSAIRDQEDTRLFSEFIALANHRPAVRHEMALWFQKFRALQAEALAPVLRSYGLDPVTWPPTTISLAITGISWYLLLEDAFAVEDHHSDAARLIETRIRELEGKRRSSR